MSLNPEKINDRPSEGNYYNMARPTKLFRELTSASTPIKPLPPSCENWEEVATIVHSQFYIEKCTICNSDLRNLAEHVFVESGKKVMSVLRFFNEYYSAKLNYTQIATHMEHHCNMKSIGVSGLKSYEEREEEINVWKFREDQLALTALMVELDDVRGMDCSKNNELKLKRATLVDRLIKSILEVKSKRDEGMVNAVNIFEVLTDIHDALSTEEDKRIVREKVKEIRIKLAKSIYGETTN